MPLYFKKKIKVNINGVTVDKYVAYMHRGEIVTIKEIAEMVEEQSGLTGGDLVNGFYQMLEIAGNLLTIGHRVNLDPLGSLFPGFNAKACDTPQEVTADTVTRFYPLFKASPELKSKFSEASFHLRDDIVVEVKYKRKERKESTENEISVDTEK
jgi:predicted histone-like DNA-binding protein